MPTKRDFEHLKEYQAETVIPNPASLIETFRAIGYSLPSALADIIDNSIAAGAKNIWVTFKWNKESSFITIHDDGYGMTLKNLVEAMRPGTHNPLDSRKNTDLGRFGLGLKTASFSQCRVLTVISKEASAAEINHRTWDLDYVEHCNEWQILNYLPDNYFQERLNIQTSGTTVIWENLDRIIYDYDKTIIPESKFYENVRESEQYIAMVFHRLIDIMKLKIWINERIIIPWDPFVREEIPLTQSFPTETFSDGQIKVTGYVLPHQGKISAARWNMAAGPLGWNAQQGFYIYRRNRLLVAADWLQLFRKDEHTRLARIMIEIDSELDFAWQLDIRKSRAIPPKMFMGELKRYATEVRRIATEVYKHRGKQKQRQSGRSNFEFAWITIEQNGRDYFKINRKHPLVRSICGKNPVKKGEFEKFLRLLEITLPIPAIVLNQSLFSENIADPELPVSDSEISELLRLAYKRLIEDGLSPSQAQEELFYIDPFSNYPHLIETFKTFNE